MHFREQALNHAGLEKPLRYGVPFLPLTTHYLFISFPEKIAQEYFSLFSPVILSTFSESDSDFLKRREQLVQRQGSPCMFTEQWLVHTMLLSMQG